METIINGSNGKTYEILDRAGNNYLLRDTLTKNYVIAHGFRNHQDGWEQGKYFGSDEESLQSAKEVFQKYTSPTSYGYR